MKEKVKAKLSQLVDKKYIYLTKRGNDSIDKILNYLAEKKGNNQIYLQKEGGWMTYPDYAEKYFEKVEYLELKNWQINLSQLIKGVLLINSMPGYSALQNMNSLQELNEITIINDVSGSIGTNQAKKGDYIIGSFGRWKPLSIGQGGFIASNHELPLQDHTQLNLKELDMAITNLNNRLEKWQEIKNKVVKDLAKFNIISTKEGINVIITYDEDNTRETLIKYCQDNKLEYTQCPRYIRTLKNAISIEIKRRNT